MKCEQQLTEKHAVELLMGSIDDQMAPYLAMATINTFQELLDRVAKFERLPKYKSLNLGPSNNPSGKGRQSRPYELRKDDVNATFAFTVDKRPNEGPKTSRPMTKPVEDKRRSLTLQEKKDKQYSFKRECTSKIFRHALKLGLKLPELRRPEQADKVGDPNYCPYHRFIGHPIEDCFVFKDWVEKSYQNNELTLSDSVLINPKKQTVSVITTHPTQEAGPSELSKNQQGEEESNWETFISRKTKRMINILSAIKAVRWKNSLEPEIIPGMPLSNRGQFLYNSKNRREINHVVPPKPHRSKKRKPRKSKSKIQKLIDSLDEYEQPPRRPIKLEEYMLNSLTQKFLKMLKEKHVE